MNTSLELLYLIIFSGILAVAYSYLLSGQILSASDGNADDVRGLINFVRGKDYFDYNGGCNLTEDREHLLADIYHSQLVEVGAPNANIDSGSGKTWLFICLSKLIWYLILSRLEHDDVIKPTIHSQGSCFKILNLGYLSITGDIRSFSVLRLILKVWACII